MLPIINPPPPTPPGARQMPTTRGWSSADHPNPPLLIRHAPSTRLHSPPALRSRPLLYKLNRRRLCRVLFIAVVAHSVPLPASGSVPRLPAARESNPLRHSRRQPDGLLVIGFTLTILASEPTESGVEVLIQWVLSARTAPSHL